MLGLTDIDCMKLALELAAEGRGHVSPNPMVGAVLCYQGSIIGKGWHQYFGGPHAEVNCLDSVATGQRHLIPLSTMYVTLEPCAHFGKTPPCADLLIRSGLKHVVVATTDPFESVSGKGIARMKEAGIRVDLGLLEAEALALNCSFITYHTQKRPYITLKWAETADGFIGTGTKQRLYISGEPANKLVHSWRAASDAILIGAATAVLDDPLLTVREVPGKSPLRVVIQVKTPLPPNLKMFLDGQPVVVVSNEIAQDKGPVLHLRLQLEQGPESLLDWFYKQKIQSVLVEGGKKTLEYFLNSGYWDEVRVIKSRLISAGKGIASPTLPASSFPEEVVSLGDDVITTYKSK